VTTALVVFGLISIPVPNGKLFGSAIIEEIS
jgi:hypothetical protein